MVEEQMILEQIPCGIVIIDQEDRIRYVNDWVARETGFLREDLLNAPLSKILQKSGGNLIVADPPSSILASLRTEQNAAVSVYMSIRTVPSAAVIYTYCCIMPVPDSGVIPKPYSPVSMERDHYHGLFGKAPRMQEVYGFIEMAAETDVNVVIQGESGTGKELVASAIHRASNRKEKPFVKVNCAALTESLLESELFGHAKGAFTGAYRDHEGKFEIADKGTIFLDEIGEISPAMQVKLLRVLQERIVVRVGDNREIQVNVRVVAATNKNLRSLVTKGKFREDLFYRLNVFPIHMPALRERGTDVPLLITHFINKFCSKTGKQIECYCLKV